MFFLLKVKKDIADRDVSAQQSILIHFWIISVLIGPLQMPPTSSSQIRNRPDAGGSGLLS
jgi:hypothetical protein